MSEMRSQEEQKSEIILVDKAKGQTSYDVIRELKRNYPRGTKIGHAGTLDPNATGLMIVAVGRKTKELAGLLKLPKTYIATIRFGLKTDSGDITGKVVEEKSCVHVTREKLAEVLAHLQGEIELPVPIFSAVKRGGKRLYEYARKGIAVTVPKKIMRVDSAKLISSSVIDPHSGVRSIIEWSVGSGTYIRSLAEKLAENLGTVATLEDLRRIKIGEFVLSQAIDKVDKK